MMYRVLRLAIGRQKRAVCHRAHGTVPVSMRGQVVDTYGDRVSG